MSEWIEKVVNLKASNSASLGPISILFCIEPNLYLSIFPAMNIESQILLVSVQCRSYISSICACDPSLPAGSSHQRCSSQWTHSIICFTLPYIVLHIVLQHCVVLLTVPEYYILYHRTLYFTALHRTVVLYTIIL